MKNRTDYSAHYADAEIKANAALRRGHKEQAIFRGCDQLWHKGDPIPTDGLAE